MAAVGIGAHPRARREANHDEGASVAGTAAGEFIAAFPALHDAAYRIAYRLLGNRDDAAECAQEACARAFVRWRRLSEHGLPTAWVVRVSANLALDRCRRAARARRAQPGAAAGATSVPAAGPDRVDVHRALDRLPRRQRQVVVLRYLADLAEADVARALGISAGSVKQHAARGLAALRGVLEG